MSLNWTWPRLNPDVRYQISVMHGGAKRYFSWWAFLGVLLYGCLLFVCISIP